MAEKNPPVWYMLLLLAGACALGFIVGGYIGEWWSFFIGFLIGWAVMDLGRSLWQWVTS